MLGGSGEPEDGAAADSPYAALANAEGDAETDPEPEANADPDAQDVAATVKEPVPMATYESPQAVLDRLTQYANAARAIPPVDPEEPENAERQAESQAGEDVEPDREMEPAPDSGSAVGDDFLPSGRGLVRRRRGRKRHP
jgi:hypothetical protein